MITYSALLLGPPPIQSPAHFLTCAQSTLRKLHSPHSLTHSHTDTLVCFAFFSTKSPRHVCMLATSCLLHGVASQSSSPSFGRLLDFVYTRSKCLCVYRACTTSQGGGESTQRTTTIACQTVKLPQLDLRSLARSHHSVLIRLPYRSWSVVGVCFSVPHSVARALVAHSARSPLALIVIQFTTVFVLHVECSLDAELKCIPVKLSRESVTVIGWCHRGGLVW